MAHIQTPLYSPCYAAHAPLKLRDCAVNKVSALILSYCLPQQIRNLHPDWHYTEIPDHKFIELDKIILCLGKDKECAKILQTSLKNSLKRAQLWWNSESWFGVRSSFLRRLVQDGMALAIDRLDNFFQCPLLKFTLQLLFTREAGLITTINNIDLELPKIQCTEYYRFLTDFDAFQIESLVNTSFIFGDPSILVKVLSNSPYLKKIHLRYNSSDYIVQELTHLKFLEIFICESFYGSCLVSVACLYKTFFSGLSKRQILDNFNSGAEINLTFPNLKYTDIGKNYEEFLSILQFFYRSLKSLSCCSKSNSFTVTNICKFPIPPFNENFSFTIHDIGLTPECILKLDLEKTIALLPQLKHVTLYIDKILGHQNELYRKNTTEFLSSLDQFSLTLVVSYESIGDALIHETFFPIFQHVAEKIVSLQFNLKVLDCLKTYWELANVCPNLNLFSFAVSEALSLNCLKDASLSSMPGLVSLSITFSDVSPSEKKIVRPILDQLLNACPNIEVLELALPSSFTDWVMTYAAKGAFKNVNTFIIKMTPETFYPDVDFYVPVVEAMENLKSLILLRIPNIIFAHMRKIFQNTELKVSCGKKRKVAYTGVANFH